MFSGSIQGMARAVGWIIGGQSIGTIKSEVLKGIETSWSSKTFQNALSHAHIVIALLIAVYGLTWVIDGFSKAFSAPRSQAEKVVHQLLNTQPRTPDSKVYDQYKNKCNPLQRRACFLQSDCEWNTAKNKCSVNRTLKFRYKVAKD